MKKNYALCWENLASKNKKIASLLSSKVFSVHETKKLQQVKAQKFSLQEIITILDNAPDMKTKTFGCSLEQLKLVEI
jgi:hypothetical protein